MGKVKGHIGGLLVESLTKDQIVHLLDVLFSTIDMDHYREIFEKADLDMAETIDKIVEMRDSETDKSPVAPRIASDQRIIEIWNSLWERWDSLIGEVGDEDGKYAAQEEEWEPAYFDGSALADDLEPIAADMFSLIDDVYDLVDNPDLFSEAMDEIDSSISSYPEEMGVGEGDGCTLGTNATRCILKWLWLSSKNEASTGKAFLNEVFEIEDQYSMVNLNDDECVDFFVKLPDEVGREIYHCFKSDNRGSYLDNIYSSWHKINHLYEERFDPARYLETCRKHLGENWRYGRPLIDEAISQGDFQEAESLLIETFSSYLRPAAKDKKWYPETALLIEEHRYFRGNEEDINTLLETWSTVSKRLGNTKRSVASQLQSLILRAPDDWDAVIGEYKRGRNSETKETVDPLFVQWQNEMARRSVSTIMDRSLTDRYIMNRQAPSVTWIHWLIEAELDTAARSAWFMEKLNAWLAYLKENVPIFREQWPWLARLTKDMPSSSTIDQKYPTFFKIVLPQDFGAPLLSKVRRSGLQKMDAASSLSTVMDAWKSNLRHIIPDPENAHSSDYTSHAQWMKALYELSREEYNSMLTQWQVKHKRRRNLWRDMKNQSLPV